MLIPGLVSITFRPLSPREIVDLVRRGGLRAIEWGGDVHVPHGDVKRAREVAAMTADAGLTTACYGSYYRAGAEENPEPQAVVETAQALGAPSIRIWAGKIASADADAACRQRVSADILRIAELADACGIRIGLEYHCNTLTDTNESALLLMKELQHPNVAFNWQPPNGKPEAYALDGLRGISPVLGNLHVFSWDMDEAGKIIRRELAAHAAQWKTYLSVVDAVPASPAVAAGRFALIEFVVADSPDQFLADAATLLSWL